MENSFLSRAGWQDVVGDRGLEIFTETDLFRNNRIENNFVGAIFRIGSAGSTIRNNTI